MVEVIYDKHSQEWRECLESGSQKDIADTWLEESNTLNTLRQKRVNNLILPLATFEKKLSWLTVGDGRYASDGRALQKMGVVDVHCSDMDDTLLKIAYSKGKIKNFSKQNAEFLSFDDNSYDYTLCKESYHHFPRPFIALNEMMRVSRFGVLLVEPRDNFIDRAPFYYIINFLRKLFRKNYVNKGHGFEAVGNYVYSLSEREMEKFQLGMHRTHIAFAGLNDNYEEGFEFLKLENNLKKDKRKILKFKMIIYIKDFLEKIGFIKSGLLFVLLFKQKPSEELIKKLKTSGFKYKHLPSNPYVNNGDLK